MDHNNKQLRHELTIIMANAIADKYRQVATSQEDFVKAIVALEKAFDMPEITYLASGKEASRLAAQKLCKQGCEQHRPQTDINEEYHAS